VTHGSIAGAWDRAALGAGSRGTVPRRARGHVGPGLDTRAWVGYAMTRSIGRLVESR
jgi:hypothetical protein